MARIVDYTSLQTAVAKWLWREGDADLAAEADAFIDLFETNFRRDQRLPEMQETFTTPITKAAVPLNLGFLEMVRVKVSAIPNGNPPEKVLTYVTPDEAATLDATEVWDGTISHYTILSNNLILVPQKFAPIGALLEVTTYVFNKLYIVPAGINWLITEHPDVYLYGSLMQAAAYIDDDATVAKWKGAHDIAMASIQSAGRKKRFSGSPIQMRPSMSFISGPSTRPYKT